MAGAVLPHLGKAHWRRLRAEAVSRATCTACRVGTRACAPPSAPTGTRLQQDQGAAGQVRGDVN